MQRNGDLLAARSTANVARDIDLLRQALGERQITYLGYLLRHLLGATYARLFPRHYRAMVLDGPLDADAYINRPQRALAAQTTGFEDAFRRFCGARAAQDDGAASTGCCAASTRIPRRVPGGRTLDGDDARAGISIALYNRADWPTLAYALSAARGGNPRVLRALADIFYGRRRNGTYDPESDATSRSARPSSATRRARPLLARRAGARSPGIRTSGSTTATASSATAATRRRDPDAYAGPWRLPRAAPRPLLVATTHDPATPYGGARRLARELHRARLLTMRGDGHTAYPGNSRCVDRAVERYLSTRRTLPRPGTTCRQAVPATASAVPRLPERPLR